MAKKDTDPKLKKIKDGIVGIGLLAILGIVLVSCITGGGKADEKDAPPAASDSGNMAKDPQIVVSDLSADGTLFVSAEFSVADSLAGDGIETNLKDGCVSAILAAKAATENWADYNTIQCMGMSDWGDNRAFVGSANFSGAQLSEISDAEMEADPSAFWDAANESSVSPQL